MRILLIMLGLMLVAGQARAEVSLVDRLFLRSEAQGSAYELAIAQLAQQRATRQDVRAYATMVANDHEAYNGALRDLAKAKGVALPPGMTARSRSDLERLGRIRGAAFDSAFIREARRINATDVSSFRSEALRTADPDLKMFVQKFIEVDQKHEDGARALAGRSVASRMPVIVPPPAGQSMPVITPPVGGAMPVIPPPAPAAK